MSVGVVSVKKQNKTKNMGQGMHAGPILGIAIMLVWCKAILIPGRKLAYHDLG